MTGFQRLLVITCAVIFGLIVLGGVVKATDSGLGCPDWPTCHGKLIPQTDKATLIEFSHRTVAAVAGFLVLGILVVAWRNYRNVPAILYPAIAALVLIIIQAGLGGAAVVQELPAEVIMVHLGTALTIFLILGTLTLTAFTLHERLPAVGSSKLSKRLLIASLVATFVLMLVGAYVAGSDYTLACAGWPLCNGEVFPSDNLQSIRIHFLHRFIALVAGLIILAYVAVAYRERDSAPLAASLALATFGVFIAQTIVGAANIWTEGSELVAIAHLAVATLIWTILGYAAIRVFELHELLPRAEAEQRPSRLAKAAQ